MNTLSDLVSSILPTLLYLMSGLLLFSVGRFIYMFWHKKVDLRFELVKKDNFAFAITQVGYYIAILIVTVALIANAHEKFDEALFYIIGNGLLGILLINVASLVNDKLILHRFRVHKEIIEDENTGTGVIEAGNYIANGMIIFGAIGSEPHIHLPNSPFDYVFAASFNILLFWGIGQTILVLATAIYNFMLPYNAHQEIEKDNYAVGLGFAGATIALGILVSTGVLAEHTGWLDHLGQIVLDVGLGLVLLPAARWVTDVVLLPGERLTDEIINQTIPNFGAGLMEAFSYIGSAVLIVWCL